MVIIGLNGSPNKEGNTKFLLNKVLGEAAKLGAETQIFEIPELLKAARHSFCIACSNPCNRSCYKGTKLEEAFEAMKKADGLVFGTPVYFGSVSGQLKAFFDKTRYIRRNMEFYNKVGAGITVGASMYGGQETAMRALHDSMLINGMIIVSDGFSGEGCGHHGVCANRPAAEDQHAVKQAEMLGKRLFEVCQGTISLRK